MEWKEVLIWMLPSAAGVVALIAIKRKMQIKMDWERLLISLIIGCFVGWIVNAYLSYKEVTAFRAQLIALGALFSESTLMFLFKNERNILKTLLAKWIGATLPDEENKK